MTGVALTGWDDGPPCRLSLTPSHSETTGTSRLPIASLTGGSAWPAISLTGRARDEAGAAVLDRVLIVTTFTEAKEQGWRYSDADWMRSHHRRRDTRYWPPL